LERDGRKAERRQQLRTLNFYGMGAQFRDPFPSLQNSLDNSHVCPTRACHTGCEWRVSVSDGKTTTTPGE
jgi:hypothetical protein